MVKKKIKKVVKKKLKKSGGRNASGKNKASKVKKIMKFFKSKKKK